MIKNFPKIFYLILVVNFILIAVFVVLVWQIDKEKNKLIELALKAPSTDSFSDSPIAIPVSKLKEQLITIDNYFVSANNTVEFLEKLEEVARITKTSLKISKVEAETELSLNLSLEGSFSALNHFIILLENFPYSVRIVRLDLQPDSQGNWQGNCRLTVLTKK